MDAMMLVFWMLSFKPTFSLSSFTFNKRLFSSSSLSTIRVVSSAYLRLLIFLLAILIPACASSSQAFLMMYSSYKLNKQGDNIQPEGSIIYNKPYKEMFQGFGYESSHWKKPRVPCTRNDRCQIILDFFQKYSWLALLDIRNNQIIPSKFKTKIILYQCFKI